MKQIKTMNTKSEQELLHTVNNTIRKSALLQLSVDQELEDAFKDLYKDTYHTAWEHLNNPIHPLHNTFLNFKAGANWKAEQSANDAIEFGKWWFNNGFTYNRKENHWRKYPLEKRFTDEEMIEL